MTEYYALQERFRLQSEIAELADEVAFWKYQAVYGRAVYLDRNVLLMALPEDSRVWKEAEFQLAQARIDERKT